MQASLTLLAGDVEETKQLLRGFTGTPGILDRETRKYQNELRGITERWMRNVEDLDEYELSLALATLIRQLQNAAERHLRKAYKLGLGMRPLSAEDEDKLDRALEQNLLFLETSLAPAIEERIIAGLDPDTTFADAVRGSTNFSSSRIGLYAGAFWTMIWVGREAAMERVFGPQAPKEIAVRRLLDPGAAHCASCPPKAHEYSSWDEMLAYTGGLPADGSDDCHSNCRCTIQVQVGSQWVYVI